MQVQRVFLIEGLLAKFALKELYDVCKIKQFVNSVFLATHTTYRKNNNLEKCAGMGLNGFYIK